MNAAHSVRARSNISWVFYAVSLLIVASVFYELFSGVARIRGVGLYARSDTPAAYWLVIVSKAALAFLLALLPLLIGH